MSYYVLEKVFLDTMMAITIDGGDKALSRIEPVPSDVVLPLSVLVKTNSSHALSEFQQIPDILLGPSAIDLFKGFDLPDVQFVPTELNLRGETITSHSIMHSTNMLDVIDPEASTYKELSSGKIIGIKSLALREDMLDGVENNRFFRLERAPYVQLVNQELADEIRGANIESLRLIPVTEWHSKLNLTPKRLKKLGLE